MKHNRPKVVIVIAFVGTVLVAAVSAAVWYSAHRLYYGTSMDAFEADARAERQHARLWQACRRYVEEHSGKYPSSLEVLVLEGYIDDAMIRYVGRERYTMEILYRAPTDDATEDAIMLCDSNPTYEGVWTRGYVVGRSPRDRYYVYATTVGGYQDYVPLDQVRMFMKSR